jgi:4-hydroxy-2-oxoheptanedioate aldolase
MMATTMQQANTLRRVMEEGKGPSMGVWQTFPGSNLSRTIARCGFDWIVVDCEHGNIDGKLILYYEPIRTHRILFDL